MALTTKPKPKAHHRKRQAQHHKHNKHYVKAYWPYLPMLGLVAVGVAINSAWSSGNLFASQQAATLGASVGNRPASRLETLLGGQANWLLLAVIILTAAAFAYFVVTHSLRLQKAVVRGERFVAKRPLLDITVVGLVVVGALLTRSSL